MGEIRKQWWRDAVEAVYGDGTPPVTPTVAALAAAIAEFRLPRRNIDDLIDAPTAQALMTLHLRVLANGADPNAAVREAGAHVAAAWDSDASIEQELIRARELRRDVPSVFYPALMWSRVIEMRRASRLRRQLAVGWAALVGRY